MDDTAQASPVVPIQPPNQTIQQPVTPNISPVQPIGGLHKEFGPIAQKPVELVKPAEPMDITPEISAEVKEAGVEATVEPEVVVLTEQDKQAGLPHAKESTPVLAPAGGGVQLPNAPFTVQEALEVIKTTPTNSSRHWLAVLMLEVMKKVQFNSTNNHLEGK